MAESQFYHIKLFSKGKIEIFQNVFWHKLRVENGKVKAIDIQFSSLRNRGAYTSSVRPMDEVYNFEVGDGGNHELLSNVPPIDLIMHGYFKEEVARG